MPAEKELNRTKTNFREKAAYNIGIILVPASWGRGDGNTGSPRKGRGVQKAQKGLQNERAHHLLTVIPDDPEFFGRDPVSPESERMKCSRRARGGMHAEHAEEFTFRLRALRFSSAPLREMH